MSDKQPLIDIGDSSDPPPYNPHDPQHASPYPTGGSTAAFPQAPLPAYSSGHPPPPQAYSSTTNITVVQARPVGARVIVEAKPPNHIILSAVVIIVFCWVFGLIALMIGMQVDSVWASGDRDGARRLSAAARGWNIAGMIVGGTVYVLAVIASVASTA